MGDIGIGPAGTVPFSDGAVVRWQTPTSGALTAGVENFDAVEASENQFMTNNQPNGRLYCMAVIPSEDINVSSLSFLIAQNNAGGTGGVAVYNAAGVRQSYSSLQSFALGVNSINLNNGGPTMMSGGSLYYFGIEADINACGPISIQGNSVYNPPVGPNVPPLAFFVPNSRSVDPTGFPPNVSAFFGQVGGDARKYWMLGTP